MISWRPRMRDLLMQDDWWSRFGKFILTGIFNTALGYGLFSGFYLAGFAPQTALIMSFSIGVLINFVLHGRFVFGTTGYRRLPAYIMVYVGTYFVNRWGLGMAIEAGISPLVAQFFLLFVTAVLAFFGVSIVLTGKVPFLGIRILSPAGSE